MNFFLKQNIKRLGRGRSSGKGRFSTRGNHGQGCRTSVNIPVLFEGGTKPLYIRVPKHGFNNRNFSYRYVGVSLGQIQYLIDTKRIDPSQGTITIKTLHDCGLLKGVKWPGFKLLSTVCYLLLIFLDFLYFKKTTTQIMTKKLTAPLLFIVILFCIG